MPTAKASTSGAPHESPEPAAAAGLRARLRAGTREAHEALDARFLGMAESDGPDLYRRFVAMNRAAFAALVPALRESPLGGASGALAPLDAALRALEADARAMALPLPRGLPAFPGARPGLAEAVGIAYVLEGSKLGARYLHRRIAPRRASGSWPDASLIYLELADGAGAFPAYLTLLAQEGPDAETSLGAANAAFAHFAAVLDAVEADEAALAREPETRKGDMTADRMLHGLNGLVVEDNMIIALDAEQLLLDSGMANVFTAGSVSEARRIIETQTLGVALLDVNLGRETSFPLVGDLNARNVPFVFVTGYGEVADLPPEAGDAEAVKKPYAAPSLVEALTRAIERSR